MRRKVCGWTPAACSLPLVVGLVHQEEPEQEQAKGNHQAHWNQSETCPSGDINYGADQDAPPDLEHDASSAVQDRLHGMKTHESVAFIRFKNEEENPRNESKDVCQRAGQIRGHRVSAC